MAGGAAVPFGGGSVVCALLRAQRTPFLDEFFVRHHLQRFSSGALLHVQPWWFYLARLPALMLPWTPLLLLPLVRGRAWYREPRRRFLLAWFGFGLVLFSASANKLPGYVLPLLPAAAVLVALALDEIEDARGWLLACAALLIAFPIAAPLLPAAVANEWSAAPRPAFHWTWLTPAIPRPRHGCSNHGADGWRRSLRSPLPPPREWST